jgi:sec-independent protein translocase protein TatA
MFSSIGVWEIIVVVAIILLLFGAAKLPQMAQSLGRSLTSFKKGLKETTDDVKEAIKEDRAADTEQVAEIDSKPTDTTGDSGKTE